MFIVFRVLYGRLKQFGTREIEYTACTIVYLLIFLEKILHLLIGHLTILYIASTRIDRIIIEAKMLSALVHFITLSLH